MRSSTVNLALLNHYQKRQKLQTLCESLQTIKTLQHTDVRLREMLEVRLLFSRLKWEFKITLALLKHFYAGRS